MERIPLKIDSKFRYVLLASHRAEQLMRGATAKIELPRQKITRVAMEEVIKDLVTWDYGRPEADPPVEPEADTELLGAVAADSEGALLAEPAAGEPAAESAAAESPAAESPAAESPAAEPAAGEPAVGPPAAEEPGPPAEP